ncbi:MFS transporter [Lysinibacillus sphaericus]
MYMRILKNRTILFYLIGGGVSRLGDILSGMAFLFIVYDLTDSEVMTTGMVIAGTLPYLLFGLAGGVIGDWLPKKRLLIWIDTIRIPFLGLVIGLFYLELLSYLLLLAVSFSIQLLGCFFNPAHRAVLPLITTEEERTTVNSMNDSLTRGITVLTPVLPVLILRTVGPIHFFTVDIFSYAISILCISRLKFKEVQYEGKRTVKDIFKAIMHFVKWTKGDKTIRRLFLLTFYMVFFNTWVWQVGILLAFEEISAKGEELFSVFQGVFGFIIICANLIIPFLFKKMNLKTYLLGSSVWAAGIMVIGIFYGILPLFLGAAIVGLGLPLAGLARVYLLQTLIPQDMLGRGFSFNAFLLYLANAIALAVYGVLVSYLSIETLFIVSGICMLIPALVFIMLLLSKFVTVLNRRSSI